LSYAGAVGEIGRDRKYYSPERGRKKREKKEKKKREKKGRHGDITARTFFFWFVISRWSVERASASRLSFFFPHAFALMGGMVFGGRKGSRF
jgi:hypothetical protein